MIKILEKIIASSKDGNRKRVNAIYEFNNASLTNNGDGSFTLGKIKVVVCERYKKGKERKRNEKK